MSQLTLLSFSIEQDLLDKLEDMIKNTPEIKHLEALLQQPKGVLHATLSMTSTGKQLR